MQKALMVAQVAVFGVACGNGSTSGECDTVSDCPNDYPYVCVKGQCVPATHLGGDPQAGDPQGGDPQTSGDGLPPAGDVIIAGDGIVVPDLAGPVITIVSPGEYEIVRGWLLIRLSVVDLGSGVDEASVAVTITGAGNPAETHSVTMTASSATDFVGVFDTTQLGQLLHPTVVAVAQDRAIPPNASEQGHAFTLDNAAPIIGLTSEVAQVFREIEGGIECSLPFPPLGASALDHGDIVSPAARYGMIVYPRVRIEDDGNGEDTGIATLPIAGVDDATTFLFILDQHGLQAGHKLVLGNGAGSACTRIDPSAMPDPGGRQPDQAVVQKLVPVPPGGAGDYSAPPPAESYCTSTPDPPPDPYPDPPEPVCEVDSARGLTYWIWGAGGAPAIYVANAYSAGDLLTCTGGPFDARTLAEGPACVAAMAADRVGNVGISAPIAICVNHGGVDECASFTPTADLCSDGCIAPAFAAPSLREE